MDAGRILNEAAELKDIIVNDRRYLHAHPGVAFDIGDTVEYVEKALISMGYEPKRCGKAGLVALAGGKKPGKVFMLRADMDALPIKEQTDEPFKSANGCMHACGHDTHTAMLLGAALILKAHEDEINGTVKLMFQPAEEVFMGSDDMIKNGLLENPSVDAALMIHSMAGIPMTPGTVIVSPPGVSAPAADYFTIKVKGTGCHGSMPNMGVDPINAAAHILIALQEIGTREIAISDNAVLTIGKMNAGTAANAIADEATMEGTLRTYDEDVRAFIKKRLNEISEGIASSFRATAEVTFGSGTPTLNNNKGLAEDAAKYVKELLGPTMAFSAADLAAMGGGGASSKSAGSEDFAYVSQQVPAIMLALAAGNPQDGYSYPQHHPMVRFDERALDKGAAVYAYTAMRWLEEHA
ncbi:MAG: M20 family metallopeptidase [Eubacteriales bacterium]|nr:M20 family metallopeptidase [Eubacteriales bacterium]